MTTRPGELAKINALAGGDQYRLEVLTALAVLNERSEHQSQWMKSHDARDEARFAKIEANLGGVSSGVNDYNDAKQQILGAKRLVLGTVAVIAAIGGSVLFVFEVIKYWKAP